MKVLSFSIFLLFTSVSVNAQGITGDWYGTLKVPGQSLRVVFHITQTDSGFTTTMDSPDQGASGLPVTTTTFENSKLKLEIPAANIEYNGDFKDTALTGTFEQNGFSFPLDLTRNTNIEANDSSELKRPQEPVKPYPYRSEDVTFKNEAANVTLAGTLTLPEKGSNFPAVILITGSGQQDRNEEILGHKPFLVIADYLTRNGIAVLRYDDRGTAQSTGDFHTSTTADFATDVESAVNYLKARKEINPKKIGLIGHSEGGIIAPMVAAKDKSIDFIVLLAGPGIPGYQLLLLQKNLIEHKMKIPDSAIAKGQRIFKGAYQIIVNSPPNDTTLKSEIQTYLRKQYGNNVSDEFVNGISNQLASPWWAYFIRLNPVPFLEKVKCPVLALNGGNDVQVPPKEDLEAIEKALKKGGNKNVTIKEFPGLNHLFQESETGLPSEYGKIEQTFSPAVLEYMTDWIKKQVK